ncbi:unnamed protein product [Echinostoma caproni]|uniref:Nup96 domain-containing protein n=1 Tax=Echinostoma caproni TaxID=27848 RepID=A0A183A730_9TREM|nr:unnamed protein product [Echinostoma caproni]
MASQRNSARALEFIGLVPKMTLDAWKSVEFPHGPSPSADVADGVHHSPSVSSFPPNWPIDPIDNCAYKNFLDRSVVLCSEDKMRSLYNLEQTHTFGLRPNPYPYPVIVRPPNVDDPAIHEYFMPACRRKSQCPHYPCTSWYESLFPLPISLTEENACVRVSTFLHALQSSVNPGKRLIDSVECADQWIEHSRQTINRFICGDLPSVDSTSEDMDLGLFLQNCLLARRYATTHFDKPAFDRLTDASDLDSVQSMDLGPFDILGVETAVRYGQRIGALAHDSLHPLTDSGHVAALSNLIKRVRCGLNREYQVMDCTTNRDESLSSVTADDGDTVHGFDWFTATMFLAFRGDANLAWEFLAQFASDRLSIFIWPQRAQRFSAHANGDDSTNNWSLHLTGHFVDHILALECPNVYNTFVLAELPPSQIVRRWMKQCFWNYLDWSGIIDFMVICLLHSEPYHIYFILTVLQHLRHAVRLATAQSPTDQQQQPQQLVVFLQEEPIRGFEMSNYLDIFRQLDCKYGAELRRAIEQVNGQRST